MKPDQKEINAFLGALRESGQTNMFGAVPYILKRYPDLNRNEAGKMLGVWMDTFKG